MQRSIDRLLASAHYGERWARHWLDVARYAESSGKEANITFPHAWRYRDYVVRAYNTDKPYNRFVLEQLAGDELAEVTPESIAATGYYRLGVWDDEPADRELARYDVLDGVRLALLEGTPTLQLWPYIWPALLMGIIAIHIHKGQIGPMFYQYFHHAKVPLSGSMHKG